EHLGGRGDRALGDAGGEADRAAREGAERFDQAGLRLVEALALGQALADRADHLAARELAVVGEVGRADVGEVDDLHPALLQYRPVGLLGRVERAEAGRIAREKARYAKRPIV